MAGSKRIPYKDYLSMIGLNVESTPYQIADVSGIQIGFNSTTFRLKINKITNPENELLKNLGLKEGDELVSFNGVQINYMNAPDIFGSPKNQMKTGDNLELVVARASGGKDEKVTLKTKINKTKTDYEFSLTEMKNPDSGAKLLETLG
ncbi:MAG: hypothetical protein IPG02_17565 [Ignavibacteria bacterium]|nr:hypothetical protein [Ignavibacteria bacterium]